MTSEGWKYDGGTQVVEGWGGLTIGDGGCGS